MGSFGLQVLIISSIVIAILLNLIIPQIFIQVANEEEKKLDNEDLGFKGNLMRLIVYHSRIPLTSSVLLLIIVWVSVYLGSYIKIRPSELKSLNN